MTTQLTDDSWQKWRDENPDEVIAMREMIAAQKGASDVQR